MGGAWRLVGLRGWLWLLAAAAVATALWVAGIRFASAPVYTPLAGGLSAAATANATALLDRYGIRWELEANGRTLAVDSARAAAARRLLGGRVAAAPDRPSAAIALDPVSARIQTGLDAMVRSVLGPNRAYVAVHAMLDSNRSSATSLAYSRRGVALGSRSTAATAGGYRGGSSSVAWGHDTTITTTAYAPGAVRRLQVALIVDTSVPRSTVAQLKAAIATAAGLTRSRGDTISVGRTRFPPAATARNRSVASELVRPLLPYAPLAVVAFGLAGFAAAGIRRRESAALGPAAPPA